MLFNIKTCQSSCENIDKYLLNDYSKGIASIAINDRIITVTAAHMFYDGGGFVDLYNSRLFDLDQSDYYQSDPNRYVTYAHQEMFGREFEKKLKNFYQKSIHHILNFYNGFLLLQK